MDDFSKIQKINTVARELMRHNQASSMDAAIRMATAQVESGDIPQYLPGGSSSGNMPAGADQLPEMPESVALPKEGVSSEDIIRAVESLVAGQQTAVSRMTNVINAHTSQMQGISEKMNMIIAEIASFKDELRRLKENPVTQPPMKQRDAKEGQTQFKPGSEIPSTSVRPPVESNSASGHARTGNFKPDDVSIEKFFYYGKR
jgi:hypothetical protein